MELATMESGEVIVWSEAPVVYISKRKPIKDVFFKPVL